MRKRPCSNFRDITRAKSESKELEYRGDTGHIILVEATRRQIYPARSSFAQRRGRGPAAPHCDMAASAMLDSVVYLLYRAGLAIAAALPLRFCLLLANSSARVLGCFPANTG